MVKIVGLVLVSLFLHVIIGCELGVMSKKSACEKYHESKQRGPCAVCKENKPRYWHIAQATPRQAQLVISLRQRNISDADCICYACQLRLGSGKPPRQTKRHATNTCQLPNCESKDNVHQTSKLISPTSLQALFSIDSTSAIDLCSNNSGIFLCHPHYCALTNKRMSKNCPLCASSSDTTFRTYSDPAVVVAYARVNLHRDVTDFTQDSLICNSCYQSVSRFALGPEYVNSIKTSKTHLSKLLEPFRNFTFERYDQCEEHSFAQAVVFLGRELLDDKAVLLETVYSFYSRSFDNIVSSSCYPGNSGDIPVKKNSFQFLSKIKSSIGECIIASHISGQRRLGTLLRRCGTDVLTCLHTSLFQFSRERKDLNFRIATLEQQHQAPGRQLSWRYFSENLSGILTNASKDMDESEDKFKHVDSLNIEREIRKIPPLLWNLIVHSTLSEVEKRELGARDFYWDSHFLQQLHLSSTAHHKKMLKRYFICVSLLYTINDNCFSSIHLAISDVVDRFTSSSSVCFKFLSAFGLTVSKSTYQRFQTQIAAQEMSKKPALLSHSFAIASIDNIDRSSSYAAVSAGQTDRGFHGTSIQAVETLPSCTHTQKHLDTLTEFTVPSSSCQIDASTLQLYHQVPSCLPDQVPTQFHPIISNTFLNADSFSLSESETKALNVMQAKIFCYMFAKFVCHNEELDVILPDFKTCMTHLTPNATEQSSIHYTCILAEPADNAETIRHAIDILHDKHGVGKTIDHLVVAGDAKTYEYMLEAKRVYGDDLEWLLPYLGEWHLLKNIQAPLMKVYGDAGLKNLLGMFHRGATHAAVASASGFRKTHIFLMQALEAIYRQQIATFASSRGQSTEGSFRSVYSSLKQRISANGANVFREFDLMSEMSEMLSKEYLPFFQSIGETDATVKFWNNFIHRDMLHYASLFIAIRLRLFDLRTAAIRMLAPIFHAMDRPTYLKLVPFHMAELKQYPPDILEHLRNGAFAVSISGHNGCCVALDEAHEMLINKEFKMAMSSTGMGSMSRLLHYLPFRSRVLKNLTSEIQCPDVSHDVGNQQTSLFSFHEGNVCQYYRKLKDSSTLFQQDSQQPDRISHIFTGEVSAEVISNDLSSFYEKGEEDLKSFIQCVVLNASGSKPPKRFRRNLKTFAPKKKTMQKQTYELKDQKLQILSLRRQVALSKATNQPVDCLFQFVSLPRAICHPNGLPFKSSKARAAVELQKRYPDAFCSKLPLVCSQRTTCVIEGMFMINCPPLRIHKTFQEYAHFLYRRWIVKFLREFNATEIHVVFDHPRRHGISPKDIERGRRDGDVEEASYTEILPGTMCPSNWRAFLCVRSQKRLLVNFLSLELLRIAQQAELCPQLLVISGGYDGSDKDKAFSLHRPSNEICEAPELFSNHEEGDSRVWFHSKKSMCDRVVIYSPDRDTFHVGLPLMSSFDHAKDVYVQLRAARNDNLFIHMNRLVSLLMSDISLQKIGNSNITNIPLYFQVLYVASGCDFTSFFRSHSKKSFLDVFYRDCEFITGPCSAGKLHNFSQNAELGLLAFYRFIASVYFRKYCSAFEADSPHELFLSLSVPENTPLENHLIFLSHIRNGHFHRISGESEWMPSAEALRLHWQRCCWVLNLWAQAFSSTVTPREISSHGWKVADGNVSVVWNSEENLKKVDDNVQHLKEGCKCKKGCTRNWCKCKKQGKICSLFCVCKHCENKSTALCPTGDVPTPSSDHSDSDTGSDSSSDESSLADSNSIQSHGETTHTDLGVEEFCQLNSEPYLNEDAYFEEVEM